MRIDEPKNGLPENTEPEYWSSVETARNLRVHIATIKRWMREGLPYRRVGAGGRIILFRPSEVRAWVDAQAESVSCDNK